jgi:hypothetical protein
MTIGSDHVQSLVKTRRLLLLANQVEKKRLEPGAETPSFKEVIEGSDNRPTSAPDGKTGIPPIKPKYNTSAESSAIDKLI